MRFDFSRPRALPRPCESSVPVSPPRAPAPSCARGCRTSHKGFPSIQSSAPRVRASPPTYFPPPPRRRSGFAEHRARPRFSSPRRRRTFSPSSQIAGPAPRPRSAFPAPARRARNAPSLSRSRDRPAASSAGRQAERLALFSTPAFPDSFFRRVRGQFAVRQLPFRILVRTAPSRASSASTATSQRFAAAAINIIRATAPASRKASHEPMMLPLPPVPRRLKSGPGDACSIRTCSNFASSSSARIIGNEVRTPCPISDFPTKITTDPSRSIRSQMFG